jgi:hypothetical protein
MGGRPGEARTEGTGKKQRFRAELIEGHKGVVVALVPFDPEEVWRQKPVRLAGRRHGWLIDGSLNHWRFEGYIGERWGRFFLIVEDSLRDAAGAAVGDQVSLVVAPAATPAALVKAVEQSKRTTEPAKARADAIAPTKPIERASHRGTVQRPRATDR